MTILIADDTPEIREAAAEMLVRFGYVVTEYDPLVSEQSLLHQQYNASFFTWIGRKIFGNS